MKSDKPQIIETTNNQNSERKSQENVSNTTSQPMPNDNLRNNDIGSVKNKDSQFLEDIRPRINGSMPNPHSISKNERTINITTINAEGR
jgi:hypothetical protein